MAARTSPTFRRRRLGRRLKELRERAGLTLDDAAPLLDKTRSALGRIETGETRADVHLVRSMMDVYDAREDDLLDLAREAAKKAWWRQYGPDGLGYVNVETEAIRVFEFTLINIPGLLQTKAYMEAQMRGAMRQRTEEEIRNDITVRQIRQQRLTDGEHPLELAAVIDEAALHRAVGGPDVMRAQLARLVEANELAGVTVQVLPLVPIRHALTGEFIVLEFPEPEDPDLLFIEHVTGALHVEKAGEVRKAKLTHERLRSHALSPDESAALIDRVACERFPTP